MSSNRRPWYKWYPKDFRTDEKVQSLSAISELVYRRLLDVMWQSSACVLLNDCQRLANTAATGLTDEQFEKAWSEIQTPGYELFKITEDGKWIYSKRLREQLQEVEIRRKSGKKGGLAKAKQTLSKRLANAKQNPTILDTDTDTDIKKDNKLSFSSEADQVRLARYLFAHIKKNNPNAKEPNFDAWAVQFDFMMRIDKRSTDDIKAVIEWCQQDTFWKCNILSAAKLRQKFDQLWLNMRAKNGNSNDDRKWEA